MKHNPFCFRPYKFCTLIRYINILKRTVLQNVIHNLFYLKNHFVPRSSTLHLCYNNQPVNAV